VVQIPNGLIGCQVYQVKFDYQTALLLRPLDFADGAKLTVPPNETYESWALSGDGVPGILVGPGGETDWTEALRGLFRLCSVRRRSAAANDADHGQ
jgi:hypothetical protein